jgi:hypothetical protein
MNILFHYVSICERGMQIATTAWAKYNEVLLGNTSFLACPADKIDDQRVYKSYVAHFGAERICLYSSQEELEIFIHKNSVDLMYGQIHGALLESPTKIIPFLANAVFSSKYIQGDVFAPISHWINHHCHTDFPVLPYIVEHFPNDSEDLREALGIPENATVFGGYGGKHQFNIPMAKEAVKEIAYHNKNIYFIFLNFEKFCDISNVVFLPGNTDIVYKEKFVNTCDAMLHARSDGETFGMAVAEFSIKNKPVITYKPDYIYYAQFPLHKILRKFGIESWRSYFYAQAHLDYLGDVAITYSSKQKLTYILNNFKDKLFDASKNYDRYTERFSAKNIMPLFEKLAKEAIENFNRNEGVHQ